AQIKTAAVWIKLAIFQCGAHRLNCFRRRTKWVLVRGELDDCAWIDLELARRFLDWLSGFINGQIAQLRIGPAPDRSHGRNLDGSAASFQLAGTRRFASLKLVPQNKKLFRARDLSQRFRR